jgi:hypothetical protein
VAVVAAPVAAAGEAAGVLEDELLALAPHAASPPASAIAASTPPARPIELPHVVPNIVMPFLLLSDDL